MKLIIAADIFPPESGGPATYAVVLANELVKMGVDVKVVSLNANSDSSVVSCNLYKVSFNNKLLRYFEYLYLLWRESKEVDLVYAMGPVNAGLPALISSKLRNKKFALKVVGDYAWEQYKNKNSESKYISIDDFQKIKISGKTGALKAIESFAVRHADSVIVPSNYLKRMVIGWGADEKKVSVIYNAVEFKKIAPKQKAPGEKWLVSIGRLVFWKGMSTLLEVMALLPNNNKLKIIGDGPEYENLKFKIKNLNLSDRVQLLGNLPRKEALAYLAAADLFVLNSGYEGLSHVILEAISLDVPVIASNIGGNPEVVTSDSLFEYNDTRGIAEMTLSILDKTKAPVQTLPDKFNFETMIRQTIDTLEYLCRH